LKKTSFRRRDAECWELELGAEREPFMVGVHAAYLTRRLLDVPRLDGAGDLGLVLHVHVGLVSQFISPTFTRCYALKVPITVYKTMRNGLTKHF